MPRDIQQIKEEIRDRTDILEIIGRYTTLTRAGKNWKGLCPFHADRNPSFHVRPDRQIYKCFSCGEGGDVFTFVQKKENLDFLEAMEFLARRAGIPFERIEAAPEQKSEREEALELNRLAVAFYKERLALSPDAQAYLVKRALLKSTQDRFDLGYAPPDWEGLAFTFQKRGANLALAAKIGLLKTRQPAGSGYYDTFRNRLMFPIHDINQRVIGFGGRALGDDPAKYLNSEQSILFDKSRTLYGLHFARKHISEQNPPVFVEGYVDVITAHQAGFPQCIATLGTSLTEEHARMLARYSPKVIICYDADAAGIKATLRGAAVWENLGIENAEVRIARLPEGDDPDSILKRGDAAQFQHALSQAIPRVEFELERTLAQNDLSQPAGRAEALKQVIPILASIATLTERDQYIHKIVHLHPSHAFNISRAILQIAADVEAQALRPHTARQQGYPLTERANGAPLAENPTERQTDPPPQGAAFPYVQNFQRKPEGNYRNRNQRNRPTGLYDPSPPPLHAPALSGAEKTERQILRALFLSEWRTQLLSKLTPEDFATSQASHLFERIGSAIPDPEGNIDPMRLLRQIEEEEESSPEEEDPFLQDLPPELALAFASETENSAKLSPYLREFLEESSSALSNEPLTEASVNDCIRKLKRNRQERSRREIAQALATTQSETERQEYLRLHHQKAIELRGSPLPPNS